MSKHKHTPGPWVCGPEGAERDGRGLRIGIRHKSESLDGGEFAEVVALAGNDTALEIMRANAKLLAAAPDLYEVAYTGPCPGDFVVNGYFDTDRFFYAWQTWSERRDAAIKKAGGA